MNPCRECKQPIIDGATRCHHCTAHQSWFLRILNNGALIVGFALALLSIVAAQPVVNFLDSKKAEINVSILDGDFLHTTFMVSNTGSRPAGLQQIEIQAKTKKGKVTWFLHSKLDKKLIEPGKAYILNASNGSVIPEPIPHEINAVLYGKKISTESCDLVLQYVQMNGAKVFDTFQFPCYPVEMEPEDPLKPDRQDLPHPPISPAANIVADPVK